MEQPFEPHTTSTWSTLTKRGPHEIIVLSTVRPFGHEWQTISGNKWREVTPEDEIEDLAYLSEQSQSNKSKTMSASSSIVKPITTPVILYQLSKLKIPLI